MDQDTEDTATLLAQLRDIHLPVAPDVPNLWPVYLSLGVCVAALFVFTVRRQNRRRSWSAEALARLDTLRHQRHSLQNTAALLKQIALTVELSVEQNVEQDSRHSHNHHTIKRLHGEAWLGYLDDFYKTDFFSLGAGKIFGDALYLKHSQPDPQLFDELARLIKRRGRSVSRRFNEKQRKALAKRHAA